MNQEIYGYQPKELQEITNRQEEEKNKIDPTIIEDTHTAVKEFIKQLPANHLSGNEQWPAGIGITNNKFDIRYREYINNEGEQDLFFCASEKGFNNMFAIINKDQNNKRHYILQISDQNGCSNFCFQEPGYKGEYPKPQHHNNEKQFTDNFYNISSYLPDINLESEKNIYDNPKIYNEIFKLINIRAKDIMGSYKKDSRWNLQKVEQCAQSKKFYNNPENNDHRYNESEIRELINNTVNKNTERYDKDDINSFIKTLKDNSNIKQD